MLVQFPNVLLHTDQSDYPEKKKKKKRRYFFQKQSNEGLFTIFHSFVDNQNCGTNSDF